MSEKNFLLSYQDLRPRWGDEVICYRRKNAGKNESNQKKMYRLRSWSPTGSKVEVDLEYECNCAAVGLVAREDVVCDDFSTS